MQLILKFTLASDAVFGRGDGVAGFLDTEVDHDPFTGLPRLGGRALKGLLVEAGAELLYLRCSQAPDGTLTPDPNSPWMKAAAFLFGHPGSGLEQRGHLRVGDAHFPKDLRDAVAFEIEQGSLMTLEMLEACTTIRRQTAMNEETGSASVGSLRALRAILRNATFESVLEVDLTILEENIQPFARALLSGSIAALRRAGLRRNRGLGRLKEVVLLTSERQQVEASWIEPLGVVA